MKKITIKDIAKIASVSPSTVSRCLNDNPVIPPETRKRIKKIAEEMGFEFNSGARSLSTNKTGSVGLILPEGFDFMGVSDFFSSIIMNARKNLIRGGYDMIIDLPLNYETGESNIKKLVMKNKVDGLLIADSSFDRDTYEFLEKYKVPYVLFHFRIHFVVENKLPADSFFIDQYTGGYIATNYLINLGHRKIICMSNIMKDEKFFEFRERSRGFTDAMNDNKVEIDKSLLIDADINYEDTYRTVIDNIGKFKEATAVFAQTDLMAFAVIDALREYNIKVPEDISVIGYDDIHFSSYVFPKLTTIHQPVELVSEYASKRLIEKLKNKDTESGMYEEVKPSLIIRKSVARK